jgi:hypothetical protein
MPFFLLIGFTGILAATACKKHDENSGTAAQLEFVSVTTESDATAEVVFDDAFNNAMGVNSEVGIGGTGVFGIDSTPCIAVTTTQMNMGNRFPLKVSIDFGAAGCVGKDGRVRKGKINLLYTGPLLVTGNSATISFDNYALQEFAVQGSQQITNTSTPDKKSFTTVVTNAKINNGNNFTEWSSSKTITQVEGTATPLIAIDDIFNITGSATGTARRGNKLYQWSTAITAPLVKRYVCRWISRGAVSLQKGNTVVATLDYGIGTCDNKASFFLNNSVQEITLH